MSSPMPLSFIFKISLPLCSWFHSELLRCVILDFLVSEAAKAKFYLYIGYLCPAYHNSCRWRPRLWSASGCWGHRKCSCSISWLSAEAAGVIYCFYTHLFDLWLTKFKIMCLSVSARLIELQRLRLRFRTQMLSRKQLKLIWKGLSLSLPPWESQMLRQQLTSRLK
jgi:hypothetical protein